MIAGVSQNFAYATANGDSKQGVENMYKQYFPTRDQKGAAALANAVTNPSFQTFSKDKSIEELAKSARAELDAKYEEMKKSGKPFDFNSREGEDWYTLFQNFDRRALYAVSSNKGDKFSKEERDIASSIMSQQHGLAVGYGSGPTRLEKGFTDKFAGNETGRAKAGMEFLNSVCEEEKSSIIWQQCMTASKNAYDYLKSHEDKKRDDDDSLSLVRLLTKADREKLEDAVKRLNTLV